LQYFAIVKEKMEKTSEPEFAKAQGWQVYAGFEETTRIRRYPSVIS
jgi:hypothetical protein